MEEIYQFIKENGNIRYSIKELLGGLHKKVDNINKRLIDGDKKFVSIETNHKWVVKSLYGLGLLFFAFVGILIQQGVFK